MLSNFRAVFLLTDLQQIPLVQLHWWVLFPGAMERQFSLALANLAKDGDVLYVGVVDHQNHGEQRFHLSEGGTLLEGKHLCPLV